PASRGRRRVALAPPVLRPPRGGARAAAGHRAEERAPPRSPSPRRARGGIHGPRGRAPDRPREDPRVLAVPLADGGGPVLGVRGPGSRREAPRRRRGGRRRRRPREDAGVPRPLPRPRRRARAPPGRRPGGPPRRRPRGAHPAGGDPGGPPRDEP